MPILPLDKVRLSHPRLAADIIRFFDWRSAPVVDDTIRSKSVSDFLSYLIDTDQDRPPPSIIVQICQRLCHIGWLMESSAGGWNGIKNLYSSTIKDPAALDQPDVVRMINCGVYGFPAVYDAYKSSVIPLVNYDSHGDQQIGTCFVGGASWLLTARHCIENAASLSLRGTSVAMLERANFFAHPDDALDLALIQFDEPVFHDLAPLAIPVEDAVILDEVMALGYPNVPGFLPTLAAEAAKVSGRLAATVGRIASQPTEIFSKVPLLLITARVRGGFSGGPVVDSFGQAVGIVSREPAAQQTNGEWQAYDNLGYGTAIPSKAAVELTSAVSAGSLKALDMSGVQFRNFI